MSNRQKQRGNNRNGMNPANAEPIQLEEAEDLEVSTEDSPSIEEGREYYSEKLEDLLKAASFHSSRL